MKYAPPIAPQIMRLIALALRESAEHAFFQDAGKTAVTRAMAVALEERAQNLSFDCECGWEACRDLLGLARNGLMYVDTRADYLLWYLSHPTPPPDWAQPLKYRPEWAEQVGLQPLKECGS